VAKGFLQRYIGYCCTGLTTEHVFVFAYGTGANGKSTFINTIAGIFGDYATVADMSTFISSNVEHHPTDLAKLRGAWRKRHRRAAVGTRPRSRH
jgi:putative DNA primase/helicase